MDVYSSLLSRLSSNKSQEPAYNQQFLIVVQTKMSDDIIPNQSGLEKSNPLVTCGVKGGVHLQPIISEANSVKNVDINNTMPFQDPSAELAPTGSRRDSTVDAKRMSDNAGIRQESGNYDHAVLNPTMMNDNDEVGGGPLQPQNVGGERVSPAGGRRKSSLISGAIAGLSTLLQGTTRDRDYSNQSDISDADADAHDTGKSPVKTRGGNYGGSFLSLFQPMPTESNPMSRRGSVQENIEMAIASCHGSNFDLTTFAQIDTALTLQPLEILSSPGGNKRPTTNDEDNKGTPLNDDKFVDASPLPPLFDKIFKGTENGGNVDTSLTLPIGQCTLPSSSGPAIMTGTESSRSCNSDGFKLRRVTPEHFASGWECVLMGWVMVAGGQLYGWNTGFVAGFGTYFVAQILVGFSYCIMLCCIGENTAALCFPGGSYGLTRVVLGFYSGFMVGAFEMMEYIFMCSAAVAYMGDMAETTLNLDHKWAPLLWLVFYAFAIATCCTSLRNMWYTSTAIFVVTMSLLLIYVLGSLKYVNMAQYGPYWDNTAMYVPVMGNNNMTYYLDYTTTTVVKQAGGRNVTMALGTPLMPTNAFDPSYWFIGGISEFMATLALTTWAFAGVECLVLMVDMVKDPKKNIAVGCAGGVGLLMATNIATVVVAAAMPPGLFVTAGLDSYMSVGYQLMFPKLSDIGAYLMIFPGQLGMGWGFIAPMGKLLESLSASNLLPRFFMLQGTKDHRPGVVLASLCCFIINLIGFYNENFKGALQNIAIASAMFAYFANIIAYMKMATTFKQIERDFRSPFGVVGAVFALIMFTLVLISTLFFQDDGFMGGVSDYTTLKAMAIIIVFLTTYYYAFVVGTQKFSNAEQKTVFRLHVFVFNSKKGNKGASTKTGRASPWFYQVLWNGFDSRAKRFSKAVDTIADAFYSRQFERIARVFAPSMLKDDEMSHMPLSGGNSSMGNSSKITARQDKVHVDTQG